MQKFVLFFNEIDKTSFAYVGGKGANLGEMTKVNFPVPQGFCVTTQAYQVFVATSDKMSYFFTQLAGLQADQWDEIRVLGEQIRNHLEHMTLPLEVEAAIVKAWQRHGEEKTYAVRSSATAEDLPQASFAGQQDTYLNVMGKVQLLDAVQRCFASLFTDRAIAYRAKNGYDHRQVLLSVVVQEMVFPEVSGIMFTADPISGNRKVTSIDASFGLGEALVSGLVSADLYQVRDEHILQKKIATKKTAIYPVPEGGTITQNLPLEQQQAQAIADERIIELAKLGERIEELYGCEQDIEWCLVRERFYIVQSRPITSLYPVPRVSDDQVHVFMSVGHIQMMTAAMKPMAISMVTTLVPIAVDAGGRIFADLTSIFGIKILRKRVPLAMQRMDEQLGTALMQVLERLNMKFSQQRISYRLLVPVAFTVFRIFATNLLTADLASRREFVNHLIRDSVKHGEQNVRKTNLASSVSAIKKDMHRALPSALLSVVPNWLTGELALEIMTKLLHKWYGDTEALPALQRSLPGNVTSELGLMIGDLADTAREHPQIVAYLQSATNEGFYQGLQEIPDSEGFCIRLEQFMGLYGMRCPGEIDISVPRWREVPATLSPAILSHIRAVAPGEHRRQFEEAAKEAEQVAKNLVWEVRKRKGLVRAKLLQRLMDVYRNLGGLREHHKYLLVQHLDIYRQVILVEARKLVQSGLLMEISDVFYLTMDELQALEKRESMPDVLKLIIERKKQQELYKSMKPPRVMTSEGEVITGTRRDVQAPKGALLGTPVSAGVVEGYAKVVLRPEEARLSPGELMIAPFTDPGWTPLFYSAKGLVMEVGGLMTHGAVVAREYGIPAVAGIDGATEIIKNGDYIRIDGTKGYVEVLEKVGTVFTA